MALIGIPFHATGNVPSYIVDPFLLNKETPPHEKLNSQNNERKQKEKHEINNRKEAIEMMKNRLFNGHSARCKRPPTSKMPLRPITIYNRYRIPPNAEISKNEQN